ncbi:MAG: PAS domain-containing protein, partial [Armatimonadetes bacterium]|nr:PAS domain-containing protein [Armatimonadota bacterium]
MEGKVSSIRSRDVEPLPAHQLGSDERIARLSYEMRLLLLGAALVVACVLYSMLPEIAYFIALTLSLIALVAASFAVDTQQSSWLIGGTVALMHIAWIAFALQFTGHLSSPLLPLLYLVVVIYSIYASNAQTGLVVGGAVVALSAQALVMGSASSEVLLTLAGHSILLIAISWIVSKYMTQLYQAHDTARHKARRYWGMTESSEDALLVVDPGWRVQEANATAVKMLGNGDGPRLDGKNLLELLQLRHPERLRPYQDRILAGESVSEIPLTTTGGNGKPHTLLFSALPVTEENQIITINVAIRDITEL